MKNIYLHLSIVLFACTYVSAEQKQESFGNRSAEQIQSSFGEQAKSIDAIYRKELKINPNLSGKINFMIAIKNSGDVSDCTSDQIETDIGLLASKICTHILKMNFGEGKEYGLLYGINFLPE